MLTADAFGVLPPIARLTPEGAMYHFLSGYTAKVAGTEKGVTEPKATFSTCFGAPFLPLHSEPSTRRCSARRSRSTTSRVWLVNTGWTGGPYGTGTRMKIALHARDDHARRCPARSTASPTRRDPVFNLDVPTSVPGRAGRACSKPRSTWADPAAYDAQAREAGEDVRRQLQDASSDGDVERRRGAIGRREACTMAVDAWPTKPSSGSRFTPSC